MYPNFILSRGLYSPLVLFLLFFIKCNHCIDNLTPLSLKPHPPIYESASINSSESENSDLISMSSSFNDSLTMQLHSKLLTQTRQKKEYSLWRDIPMVIGVCIALIFLFKAIKTQKRLHQIRDFVLPSVPKDETLEETMQELSNLSFSLIPQASRKDMKNAYHRRYRFWVESMQGRVFHMLSTTDRERQKFIDTYILPHMKEANPILTQFVRKEIQKIIIKARDELGLEICENVLHDLAPMNGSNIQQTFSFEPYKELIIGLREKPDKTLLETDLLKVFDQMIPRLVKLSNHVASHALPMYTAIMQIEKGGEI